MSTLTHASPIACLTPAEGKTRGVSWPTGQRRLLLAMCAIVLMGLTDLACTIIYLTNIGLLEANPIARWVIVHTGVGGLIAYKGATMLFTCGALYAIRRHRASERCAWICAAILLGLMAHWAHFNAVIPSLSHEMILIALNEHAFPIEGWVTLAQH